ncbi:MAG TPA: hypothetical protein VMW71_04130 [Thermoplasmata archaeon]|nr:hypothetical protein [Thermoplasmata archaeon]
MDLSDKFRSVNSQLVGGRVSARLHPYKELKHTWRSYDGGLTFKVSDYMRGAPEDVVESLAWFLICRAREKECPRGLSSRYLNHVRSTEFWADRRSVYLSRARNLSFRPRGSAHDLAAAFEYVNSCYFDGKVSVPDLVWARESPSRRMGFYHQPLGILAVNRALDSERVPRYVLEFVVYHEMLHGVTEPEDGLNHRVFHTKEFRAREREFARYEEAQKWLSRIASSSKGNSRATSIVPQV